MTYPVFCIRDAKVGFTAPTIDQTESAAIRNFAFAINGDGVMNYAPNDFDLFRIGEFDSEKGSITSCVPELVVSGVNVFGEKT